MADKKQDFVVREHGPNPWDNPGLIQLLAEAVLTSIKRHAAGPDVPASGKNGTSREETSGLSGVKAERKPSKKRSTHGQSKGVSDAVHE
jgi:hypothetical protein